MNINAWQIGVSSAYGLLFLALLTTALAQIAFKSFHVSGRRASLLAAVALFAITPPATFLAVRELGVGQVYVLTSLSYALVAFLGSRIFAEPISSRQLQGLALIVIGCLVYTL